MDIVLSNRLVKKSRKERQCFGCMKNIPVGSVVRVCNGIYEDNFYSLFHCEECYERMKKHNWQDWIDGYHEGWASEEKQYENLDN